MVKLKPIDIMCIIGITLCVGALIFIFVSKIPPDIYIVEKDGKRYMTMSLQQRIASVRFIDTKTDTYTIFYGDFIITKKGREK